jgi:hypothetical protein
MNDHETTQAAPGEGKRLESKLNGADKMKSSRITTPSATEPPVILPPRDPRHCHGGQIDRLLSARQHLDAAADLLADIGIVDVDKILRQLAEIQGEMESAVSAIRCGGCRREWRQWRVSA